VRSALQKGGGGPTGVNQLLARAWGFAGHHAPRPSCASRCQQNANTGKPGTKSCAWGAAGAPAEGGVPPVLLPLVFSYLQRCPSAWELFGHGGANTHVQTHACSTGQHSTLNCTKHSLATTNPCLQRLPQAGPPHPWAVESPPPSPHTCTSSSCSSSSTCCARRRKAGGTHVSTATQGQLPARVVEAPAAATRAPLAPAAV